MSELKHKCYGCKYKSEHQEMMFRPFGICSLGSNLLEVEKACNAEECPFKKRDPKLTEMLPTNLRKSKLQFKDEVVRQDIEVYENEQGQFAVLVACDFGTGWSTFDWHAKELAYDKRVVEFWLEHKDDQQFMHTLHMGCESFGGGSPAHKKARDFFSSLGYGERIYLHTMNFLEIEWVDKGRFFRILGYDGCEEIEYLDEMEFMIF